MVARLVQGASAGLLTPQNSGLIQQLFRGDERGRAFGMFGFTVAVASAAGPSSGGAHQCCSARRTAGAPSSSSTSRSVSSPWCSSCGWCPDNPGGRDAADGHRASTSRARCSSASRWSRRALPAGQPRGRRRCCRSLLAAGLPAAGLGVPALGVSTPCASAARPLLDVSLLRGLPGYANGLLVGTLYFTGFTGIFLVLSVHLQEGVGFSPLQSALLLTPFAVGAAATSPSPAGWSGRLGRRVTLLALSVMMTGTALAAWLVTSPSDTLWWTLAPAMFLAGIGGGGVISPNFTLTLAEVPPADGRGRRRRAADRPADRVGPGRRAADDGLPGGRHGRLARVAARAALARGAPRAVRRARRRRTVLAASGD